MRDPILLRWLALGLVLLISLVWWLVFVVLAP